MDPNGASSNANDANNDDTKPLWRYVTKKGKTGNAGGNCKWVCSFCKKEFQGTYTRVKGHLLKISKLGISPCKSVKADHLIQMRNLEEEAQQRVDSAKPKEVSLPTSSSLLILEAEQTQQIKRKRVADNSPIGQAYEIQKRKQLDAEIARMFYTGGLPFTLARNPYYMSSYKFAANSSLSGYIPPGYNKLRTTLLQQERVHVEQLLEPLKSTWIEKGVSIVSDGWSDPQRRPLINVMVVSEGNPMFIKSVDCSGEKKNKFFISEILSDVINEIGLHKVVQVITDNAANCKGAGELIEGMYPHIFWTPCVVHTLNLALKNICAAKNVETNEETFGECNWITEIHGDAVQIKNFIMNHSMRLAMLNRFSPLKLLAVADTRFASIIVMLKRFKLMRHSLEAMVVSEQWTGYRDDDQSKANFVRDKILSEKWWNELSYIIAFTGPIYDMIRFCDTNKPCLHLVYEMWDSMIEKVKVIIFEHDNVPLHGRSKFFDVVYEILIDRWTKNNNPLHCLSHSLHPRYYSDKWLDEISGRIAPHVDPELSAERIKCLKRLFPSVEDRMKVNEEFASFSLKSGPFGDLDSIASRYDMEPRSWWACYGSSTPMLQKLAFKLLGQPSSSSCCERNWSTYSFIHSLRRNKLNPNRAQDLVFIHNNLRLLSRNTSTYQDEKTKMWDIGGDAFGSMDDEVGVLDFADLSLDDPELESALYDEGGNKGKETISDDVEVLE